jgi:hypothetical protein
MNIPILDNEIAVLIGWEELIKKGVCDRNEINITDFSIRFKVLGNPYFTHFAIERNKDETFDLLFYKDGWHDENIVDIECNILKEMLKSAVEERILDT